MKCPSAMMMPPIEHTLILPEPAVGDDAAEDRRGPRARGVRPVDRPRVFVVEAERVDHVENEERAHPVVAENRSHISVKNSVDKPRGCPKNPTSSVAGRGRSPMGSARGPSIDVLIRRLLECARAYIARPGAPVNR